MREFAFIYVFFLAFALCIAALLIVHVREEKTLIIRQEPDFFEVFYTRKKQMLETSLPGLSIQGYLILLGASPVVCGGIFWMLFPDKTFAPFMGAFCVFLPDFVIRLIVETRRKRYEERYVRALKAFASSLRSGMSVQQAVQDVSRNPFIAPEICEGFRQIDADIRVGISIERAFEIFAQKADNNDARDVAAAIAMQAEVGGSEAKVIDAIALNIEDRLVTRKRIRAVFAGTDFMVNALDVIPFLVVVMMYIGMPSYMEPVFADPGMLVVFIGTLIFTLVGSVSIRRKLRRAKGE